VLFLAQHPVGAAHFGLREGREADIFAPCSTSSGRRRAGSQPEPSAPLMQMN
jgi:hypothetical protein